jgi:hypothetical protein
MSAMPSAWTWISSYAATSAIDPPHSQTVYAGGDDGLFVSNDGGDSWRRYRGDLGNWGVEGLAIDPTGHTLYAGGIRNGVAEVSITGR